MFLNFYLTHINGLTGCCCLEFECLAANRCLGQADCLAIANIPFAEFNFDLLFKGFEIYADLSVYNI